MRSASELTVAEAVLQLRMSGCFDEVIAGRIPMNLKFIEGGKAGYKVVKFRGGSSV